MLFLGNLDYALGDTVYGPFETHPGNYVPTAPAATPTASIYQPSNYASASAMAVVPTVTAFSGSTTRFVLSFAATTGNGFARGPYIVVVSWTIAGTTYRGWFNLRLY